MKRGENSMSMATWVAVGLAMMMVCGTMGAVDYKSSVLTINKPEGDCPANTIKVEVSTPTQVDINQEFNITTTITPFVETTNIKIEFKLHDSFEVVSGMAYIERDIPAQSSETFSILAKPTLKGVWFIDIVATAHEGLTGKASSKLFVEMMNTDLPVATITTEKNIDVANSAPIDPLPLGTATVWGYFGTKMLIMWIVL